MGNKHEDESSCFETGKPIKTFNRNLEELLQTPEVKDRIIANLEYLEPEAARELARVLLWSDSAFSFGLLGKLPQSLNFTFAFLDELGRQLQNVPPHLLREFIAEMGRNIDIKSIRALARTYAPLFVTLDLSANDDPEVIRRNRDKKIRLFQNAIRTADFGKIRKEITRQADLNYPVMEEIVATIVSDPLIFANLINILPPLINHLLKGTVRALEEIDFPPEILASAVFNLLNDLDAEELGTIINHTSSLINKLHEGSAVLGQSEPRFRTVFETFLEKALINFDEKETAAAIVALGEDLEVIFSVAADTATMKPELPAEITPAFLEGFTAALRGLTYLLDQLSQLPSQSYENYYRGFEVTAYSETARLINALVRLNNRVLSENPALLAKCLGEFSQALDQAEIAHLLNNGLIYYNHVLSEEPVQQKTKALSILQQLDQDVLSRALLLTSGRVSAALAGNPRLSRSLLKAIFRVIGGLIRGLFKRERRVEGRQH